MIKLSNKLSVLDLQINSLSESIPKTCSKGSKLHNNNLNGNELEDGGGGGGQFRDLWQIVEAWKFLILETIN